MSTIRDYRRRNAYLLHLIDEVHCLLTRMEPFECARVKPARVRHLSKLMRYKRRAKGRQ